MCAPIAAQIAGKVTGEATGSVARWEKAKYDTSVIANRRAILDFKRRDALARGRDQAAQARAEGRLAASQGLAVAGASGIDPTVGSPATAIGQSLVSGEVDAELIEASAARQAWGYEVESQAMADQAEMIQKSARNRNIASILGLS